MRRANTEYCSMAKQRSIDVAYEPLKWTDAVQPTIPASAYIFDVETLAMSHRVSEWYYEYRYYVVILGSTKYYFHSPLRLWYVCSGASVTNQHLAAIQILGIHYGCLLCSSGRGRTNVVSRLISLLKIPSSLQPSGFRFLYQIP